MDSEDICVCSGVNGEGEFYISDYKKIEIKAIENSESQQIIEYIDRR